MTKKFINKNVFLIHNFKYIQILSIGLVTFKRWNEVKDDKF